MVSLELSVFILCEGVDYLRSIFGGTRALLRLTSRSLNCGRELLTLSVSFYVGQQTPHNIAVARWYFFLLPLSHGTVEMGLCGGVWLTFGDCGLYTIRQHAFY